jgi:coenzyme F420-reducing hydrogenase delta subunit/DNA-directed RNA polymerase subunit RPC12/RpoP
MCSGRVSESFILHAFEKGAPVVLLTGCHLGDCHYISANHWTMRRADRLWEHLEKLGVRPERLQLEWISAAEGPRFALIMREVDQLRRLVAPEEMEYARKVLAEHRLSRKARRGASRATYGGMEEVEIQLKCLRCGFEYTVTLNPQQGLQERACPRCKSNSVRKLLPSKE